MEMQVIFARGLFGTPKWLFMSILKRHFLMYFHRLQVNDFFCQNIDILFHQKAIEKINERIFSTYGFKIIIKSTL